MTAKGEQQLGFLFLSVSDEPWTLILFIRDPRAWLNHTEHCDGPSVLWAGSQSAEAWAMQSDTEFYRLFPPVFTWTCFPNTSRKVILWKGLKSSES